MTSVTLSPSLTFIDGGAIAECSNLSTQIIPSGLTSLSTLNEGSIFEDSGIKSVYVAWPTPVPAGQFFYGFDVSQSTLYVPQGTRQNYWVAAVWEDFGDIQEYEVSAVNQPAHHSEAKEVSRYSLDGQRLTIPVKGLNIVRYSDGTIKKEGRRGNSPWIAPAPLTKYLSTTEHEERQVTDSMHLCPQPLYL